MCPAPASQKALPGSVLVWVNPTVRVSHPPQDVLHRHALYLIIRLVCYDHGLGAGKSLLALKTTNASNEEFSLWVYQCNSLVRF